MPVASAVHPRVLEWFADNARDLPWRTPGTSAWGVLVSEVMSQQTPMSRVAPKWEAWMATWPTPADLAAAPTSEVLIAWDSLGYPRRALRLQECARAITERHDGVVPSTEEELLALPGIGSYTAAAVASFAHRNRATVLDVNIRRVLSRVFAGVEHPKAALSKKETAWAAGLVPTHDHVEWNAGVMELGALVCTSRSPRCAECPLQDLCAWNLAGRPVAPERKPRTQSWAGTDRQLRGAIMKVLRTATTAGLPTRLLTASALDLTTTDEETLAGLPAPVVAAVERVRDLGTADRIDRLVTDLVSDGLAVLEDGRLRLP